MKALFSGLRVRLLLLVLLAVLPALGSTLYLGLEQRQATTTAVQEESLRLARLTASSQGALLEGARQLLITLSQLPQVRAGASDCQALLAQLLSQNPFYANLGVIDLDGTLSCSALPFSQPVNAADRAYFQRAVETRGFAVGDYQVGRITGESSINFGYPILDAAGSVEAVVFAALDLDWINQAAAELQLPEGATLSVIDRQGTILARYPGSEQWIGQVLPDAPIIEAILLQNEGTAHTLGVDGVERLYAFTPLGDGPESSAYISVGIPAEVAYAEANRNMARSLLALLLVAPLALAAAWLFGDLFIVRKVNALLDATKRLAAGELGARVGIKRGTKELSQLAGAFNEMADSLQQQIIGRQRTEAQLLQQNRRLATLYTISRATSQSLRLGDVLESALQAALDATGIEMGGIILLEPDEKTFRLTTHHGLSDELLQQFQRFKAAERELERPATEKQPVILNVADYPSEQVSPSIIHAGIQTIVSTPILSGDKALGALALATPRALLLSAEEVELLTAIGQQLGKAIENAQLYTAVQQELAQRQRAEAKLQTYTVQLEQSNRDLQEFANVASHDLQEPLRKIQAFGDRLRARYAEKFDDDGRDYLERMQSATRRMQTLINDLLTYSRVTTRAQPFTPVSLTDVVGEVISDLEVRLEETGGRVEIDNLPTIEADYLQMRQLLQNLIGNALKYHRPDCPPVVKVYADSLAAADPPANGNTSTAERYRIIVEDNGIGFDEKYLQRILQPFQRLHGRGQYEGTGMGLAICRKIVERHRGIVQAKSAPGQGATFIVTLPVKQL